MTASSAFKYLILTWLINILSATNNVKDDQFTPIVLWHGMGDSCCFEFSLGAFQEKLNTSLPNAHIVSLQIGDSIISDVVNGYLLHPDAQITLACDIIKADPLLQNGFHALGFSQGAQFLRALVQRCPEAKVKTLVSIGGQHQGVYGLPNCPSLSNNACDYIRQLLNEAAYLSSVQKTLVQATYWHDPLHESEYQNFSTFLSDINNELTLNEVYVERLQTLENFVMIKFENDSMVQPVESEWFGFYKTGQSEVVETLQESSLYTDDRLGLRKLDEDGKLHFLSTPGNHLRFEWTWFEENIIEPFLKH